MVRNYTKRTLDAKCSDQATFIRLRLVLADFSDTPAIHIASSTESIATCD